MRTATIIGSDRITSDPTDLLIHYALGDMPCYLGGEGSEVAWTRTSHRGVHLLDQVAVPKRQRRYIFNPDFEFRINTAFAEVVRSCADTARTGFTWIIPELIEGYGRLHEMGLAHSFETWHEGKLAGGCFGVQIGAWISVESMFYRVSHASKSAYAHALLHAKDRGFALVDSNPVRDPSLNYGEVWVPQWKYHDLLREAMGRRASILPGVPAPELPWSVRQLLPVARFVRKLANRIRKTPAPAATSGQ